MLAAPLAIRPNIIKNIGPTAPTRVVATTVNCLAPALIWSNFFNSSAANSTIGVIAFKNSSPTGAKAAWNLSSCF